MNKIKTLIGGGIVATALAAGSIAGAAVIIDSDGYGFVGKGDVQYSFSWNNAQLQQRAQGTTFSMTSQRKAYIDCEKYQEVGREDPVTGEREVKTIEQTSQRVRSLNAALDGDPRQTKGQKQFTGFIIKGFEEGAGWTGQIPTCPGDFVPVSDVYYGDETGAGYTVSWNGTSVPLVERSLITP